MVESSSLLNSFVANAEHKAPLLVTLGTGRKVFISLCMIFYYLIAGFWNAPPGPFREQVFKLLRVTADVCAFEQTWNMFGPPLRTWNGHYFTTVTFADGSARICELPRMEKMNLWEKFKREKLRKLFIDNLPNSDLANYLPFICANVALANANLKNQPVLVTLTFKWVDMPAFDEKKMAPLDEFSEHIHSRTDCVYRVRPEDLQ